MELTKLLMVELNTLVTKDETFMELNYFQQFMCHLCSTWTTFYILVKQALRILLKKESNVRVGRSFIDVHVNEEM